MKSRPYKQQKELDRIRSVKKRHGIPEDFVHENAQTNRIHATRRKTVFPRSRFSAPPR